MRVCAHALWLRIRPARRVTRDAANRESPERYGESLLRSLRGSAAAAHSTRTARVSCRIGQQHSQPDPNMEGTGSSSQRHSCASSRCMRAATMLAALCCALAYPLHPQGLGGGDMSRDGSSYQTSRLLPTSPTAHPLWSAGASCQRGALAVVARLGRASTKCAQTWTRRHRLISARRASKHWCQTLKLFSPLGAARSPRSRSSAPGSCPRPPRRRGRARRRACASA